MVYCLRNCCLISLLLIILPGCVTESSNNNSSRNVDNRQAAESYVQLALGYLQQKNRDAARLNLERAFKLDPKSASAFNARAILYEQESEFELAEKDFESSLRRNPKLSVARFNYAGFLFRRERYDECFKEYLRVGEDLNYVHRAQAVAMSGRCALRIGRPEKAKSQFEQAVTLDNRQVIALIELASIEFSKLNYPLAREYLERFEMVSSKTARSLWLGIRLERIFGNKDKEASYALQLKSLHPYSTEYLEFKRLAEQ